MKIDRHDRFDTQRGCHRSNRHPRRRLEHTAIGVLNPFGGRVIMGFVAIVMATLVAVWNPQPVEAQTAVSGLATPSPSDTAPVHVDSPADRLILRVIERLALGDAFDAKIRQRVWVGGREVIGVGTYEQAGRGSGQFNLQVAMHTGDGKHTLQQICDGRLAWTREQIGESISLHRVDVGRLDQWVESASVNPVWRYQTDLANQPGTESSVGNASLASAPAKTSVAASIDRLPPSVRVGGWTEMLETLVRDYDLKLSAGRLEQQEVWIVHGRLRADVRRQRMIDFGIADGKGDWPELCPTQMVVAIAKSDSAESGFGQGRAAGLAGAAGRAHHGCVRRRPEDAGAGAANAGTGLHHALLRRHVVANRHTPGGDHRHGRRERQMSDDSFHLFPR